MMLGGRSVGVGMGLLLWWLEQSAYFDWGLAARKGVLGSQVFGAYRFPPNTPGKALGNKGGVDD